MSKRLLTFVILIFITTAPVKRIFGQEPFFVEDSPAPLDVSELFDIDIDPAGRMVAVGWVKEWLVGGSPNFPLVMIKDNPEDPWTLLDPPNFGFTFHHLYVVKFVPGTNGDFVAVGDYLPDPLIGYAHGLLIRYYRDTGNWDIHNFSAPGALFHFIDDAVFDPNDPDRLMIVGTRGIQDGGGFCFEFTTMVVDYNINTYTYSVLPTTALGGLRTIAPLPNGNFITAGNAAGDCDWLPYPVVLEVEQNLEIVHPIPPPATNGYSYGIYALTNLTNEDIFMVGEEFHYGGPESHTLAYRYNPDTQVYESFKPIDPDSSQIAQYNQLWDVLECPNGIIYSVGRTGHSYQSLFFWKSMIQSFDGESWRLHVIPDSFSQGMNTHLFGMAKLANGQVYAVGYFSPVSVWDYQTLVMYNEIITEISDEENSFTGSQLSYSLNQNYPNPFNPTTNIGFRIADRGFVSLKVFDVLGNEVATLVNEYKPAGSYEVEFKASELSSGIYLYKFQVNSFVETKKMILLR